MASGKKRMSFERVLENYKSLNLDALVSVGGDGSMAIAAKAVERGLTKIVGVPKTIDNDLGCTDTTFGFDTAVNIATDAIDRLRDTAESHDRVMLVEVMGRNAGWIALHAGLAGGAHAILIPEIPLPPGARRSTNPPTTHRGAPLQHHRRGGRSPPHRRRRKRTEQAGGWRHGEALRRRLTSCGGAG